MPDPLPPHAAQDPPSPSEGDRETALRQSEQLVAAGLALIGCRSALEVFDVIADYLAEVIPDAVALVDRCTVDARHVVVHAVTGMDSSMLARAASIVGFDLVGTEAHVAEGHADRVFVRSLQSVPGGFGEFARGYMPAAAAKAAVRVFGFRDAYVIGITDGSTVFGNISVITRETTAPIPEHVIESFVQQAFLTLARIGAQSDLARSEQHFKTIFEQAPLGIALVDSSTGGFIEVNPKFASIVGRTERDLLMIDPKDITQSDDTRGDAAHMARLDAGDVCGSQTRRRYVRPDGSVVWINVTSAPVRVEDTTRPRHLCMIEDITERMAAQAVLDAERLFSESLISSLPGVFYLIGESGEFLRWNTNLERVSGRTHDELAHASPLDLFEGAERQTVAESIQRVFDQGEAEVEAHLTSSDGRRAAYHFGGLRVVLNGAPCLIGIGLDISERKRVEAELGRHRSHLESLVEERSADLAAANEELQESNAELRVATQAKSAFLASMSHELRTPLNSIIGFSGIMAQGLAGSLNEEQSRQMAMVNRSGRHLLLLIDGILDLAKVEAGRAQVIVESLDPDVVVHEVVEAVRPLAQEKGLSLEVSRYGAGIVLRTDGGKLRQILFNLVGNAVKFTDEGGVHLAVSCEEDGEFTFSVADTGPGIATGDLQDIFEPFTQLESSAFAKSKGSGLGLRISREYAHLLGGEISVASEVGLGSTFTLRLPVEPPPPDTAG